MKLSGWTYVKIGVITGWVRTGNIQNKEIQNNTSNTNNNNNSSQDFGYISVNSVNFRKTPSTSGEIITKFARNAKVTIIAKGDSWTEIEYNGTRGYVSSQYISSTPLETTSRSSGTRTTTTTTKVAQTPKQETTANTTPVEATEVQNVADESSSTGVITGSDVIAFAKQYLGYRYVSGGSTPSSGFDCSGFTTYVYKHFGISLSRTSKGQAQNGRAVDKEGLAVGDIICFSNSKSSKTIGHVGIYIGDGKFIHAANSKKGVIISNVTGDGFFFVTARRVI